MSGLNRASALDFPKVEQNAREGSAPAGRSSGIECVGLIFSVRLTDAPVWQARATGRVARTLHKKTRGIDVLRHRHWDFEREGGHRR
jgi:hypothetical protein